MVPNLKHVPEAGVSNASPAPGIGLTSAGTVRTTLLLANQTLDVGNVVPENGTYPMDVVLSPSAHRLFIGCDGGLVVVVNTTTDRVTGAISTGGGVNSLAYDVANNEVYATSYGASSVIIINASDEQKVGTIPVGVEPTGVTYDPLNQRVLVLNYGSNNVSVINGSTNRVIQSFPVGSGPGTLAVDTANGRLFTSNAGGNVTIDDGSTYSSLGSVTAGPDPGKIAYAPSNGYLYVAVSGTNTVTAIDGATGVAGYKIPVGPCPWGVAYDPATKHIFVTDTTCTTSGNVSVISTSSQSVIATIPVGDYPFSIADDPTMGLLYTANQLGTNVSVINASQDKVVGAVGAGNQPADFAYDDANHLVYLADQGGNDVAILNGTTGAELGNFGTGFAPYGVAYDSRTGILFVTNSFSNNVTAVRAQTEISIGSINVGLDPQGIAFDPANGELYVANCGSDTVSVINGSTLSLIATVGAGSCPKEVVYDPDDERVYVANAGPLYIQGFDLNVTVLDGTTNRPVHSITVGSAPWGETFDGVNRTVVTGNLGSNNLSIINTSLDKSVGSIGNGPGWTNCLPTGVSFDALDNELFVACGGNYYTGVYLLAIEPWTGAVLGTVNVGSAPGGMLPDILSGELIVANWGSGTVSVVQPVVFAPPHFNLTFDEIGLPRATLWSAALNGTTNSSIKSFVSFSLPNGQYAYSMPMLAGYAPMPSSGTVVVQNGTRVVEIRYLQLFGVHFVETGLPPGTNWTVTWNGTGITTRSSTAMLRALNGSYQYSVTPPTGYTSALSNGTVQIQGSNVTLNVPFSALPGPGPSVGSFFADPLRGALGASFSFRLTVVGGSAPLSYRYLGLPAGCTSPNSSAFSCVPTATGNYTIEASVQDAIHRYTQAFVSIQVFVNTTPQKAGPGPGSGTFLGLSVPEWILALLLVIAVAAVAIPLFRFRRSSAVANEAKQGERPGS
jgi:YVTN family beta-propeller protein